MIWLVAGRLTRGRFELDAPSRVAYEAERAACGVKDTRTGKQIVDDLIKKLRRTKKTDAVKE